jgi:DNA polymerase III alpha subunit (gram-positive type)
MNLFERFPKYTPSEELTGYMNSEVVSTKIDKEKRYIEVCISSVGTIPKEILYRIEQEILKAYDLNYIRIFPKYNPSLFTKEYFGEILHEVYREARISKGVFNDYALSFSLDKIEIKIPFNIGGIELLDIGETAETFSKIIFREFGLNIPVSITQRDDYYTKSVDFENDRLSQLRRALEAQNATTQKDKKVIAESVHLNYDRANSFNKKPVSLERKDNIILCGNTKFDIGNKEYVVGGEFDIDNITPIRNISVGMYNIVVLGTVFSVEERQFKTKRGLVTSINVGLTDKDSSIYI